MKRTAIRRKPHKQKPWEDHDLRDYYARNQWICELFDVIEYKLPEELRKRYRPFEVQVHHIVHCHHQRHDVVSNLISVSTTIHPDWIHANEIDARICCWWVKLRKRELDVAEVDACLGKRRPDAEPFLAWLEGHAGSDWTRIMQDELIDYIVGDVT